MTYPIRPTRSGPSRPGFSLIEAVISILIVGIMLVAALNTIGASKLSTVRVQEQVTGEMLAEELMSEIMLQAFEDPSETPVFGPEVTENLKKRKLWDDVDDYDGWSASPPEEKDGTPLADMDDWSRQVTVTPVVRVTPDVENLVSKKTLHVKVTVTHQGRVVATLSTLRTDGWETANAGISD